MLAPIAPFRPRFAPLVQMELDEESRQVGLTACTTCRVALARGHVLFASSRRPRAVCLEPAALRSPYHSCSASNTCNLMQ